MMRCSNRQHSVEKCKFISGQKNILLLKILYYLVFPVLLLGLSLSTRWKNYQNFFVILAHSAGPLPNPDRLSTTSTSSGVWPRSQYHYYVSVLQILHPMINTWLFLFLLLLALFQGSSYISGIASLIIAMLTVWSGGSYTKLLHWS